MSRSMEEGISAAEGFCPAMPLIRERMVADDEGILIARSRVGDLDAFAGLVRIYQRMIYSLASVMSGIN